jgi:asparagine synthase (glutamine-hydrolysing)
MQALLAHPNVSNDVDDESIARYLRGEDHIGHRTFYRNIHKLPPATSMTVGHADKLESCYWSAKDSPAINLASDSEYVQKLCELLERAIGDRLRSDYPISCHLSGGLDSTGIAGIAARQLREVGRILHAYNWIVNPGNGADPDYYEWGNSERYCRNENIEHHSEKLDDEMLAKIFTEINILNNDTADLWYESPVRNAVTKRGGRVILSGWGGDELISSSGRGYFSQLLLRGKPLESIRAFRAVYQDKGDNFLRLARNFVGSTFWLYLPDKVRCWLRKSNCYQSVPLFCLDKDFLAYAENLEKPNNAFTETNVRNVQLGYLALGHLQQRVESWHATATAEKIEYRYPLLDKRIIEFCLGLPAHLFIKDGKRRYVYREAMRDILPDYIRLSDEKDEPRRVAEFHKTSIHALRLALQINNQNSDGYVDVDCLKAIVTNINVESIIDRRRRTDTVDGLVRTYLLLGSRAGNYERQPEKISRQAR